MIGGSSDIRIGDLPNASQKRYHSAKLFGRELAQNAGTLNHRQ